MRGIQALLTSIDVVPKEKVGVLLPWWTTVLQQVAQVKKLSMNISHCCDWGMDLKDIWFLPKNLSRLID